MSNLSDKQIGYIAGIIDGEGTVCIHKCIWKHRNSVYYRPFVKIPNTNLSMLKYIQGILGCGTIKVERMNTEKWKALYCLVFSANMIRSFLPEIVDNLIIKKEQAYLVLEFMKLSKHRGADRLFKSLHQNQYDDFYAKVKRLNLRGVVEKSTELGGSPEKDNTEPSKDRNILGVCNEHGVEAKAMMCSDLTGNSKTTAEMSADR